MHLVGDALRWLSVATLGIFLGAQLTEGAVLVPYWQSLAPSEFFAWYAANDRRLLGFFGPLTSVTVVLAVAAAAVSVWQNHDRRGPAVAAAAVALVILATFFVYFQSANASFTAGSVSPANLPAELARWATWHWVRTGLAAFAFIVAILSLRR